MTPIEALIFIIIGLTLGGSVDAETGYMVLNFSESKISDLVQFRESDKRVPFKGFRIIETDKETGKKNIGLEVSAEDLQKALDVLLKKEE